MKLPVGLSGLLLLAGCAATAPATVAPVAPVASPAASPVASPLVPPLAHPTGAPGPVAVRTILPAPPTPPAVTGGFDPEPCGQLMPCTITLNGKAFDANGAPITGPLTVSVALAGQPETVIARVTGEKGAFSVVLPYVWASLLVTVHAEGYAARQRQVDSDRAYAKHAPYAFVNDRYPPVPLRFGGPATSGDPDAPAFYLPPPGGNGVVIPASPLLPFEESTVTTVAGDRTSETLFYPSGLAAAPDGRILITESGNNRLSVLAPDGRLSVLAGRAGEYPDGQDMRDGPGPDARFYAPSDVAVAPDGTAYVADTSHAAIRRVTPDGTVTTLAGSRNYGYQDGVGAQASFGEPTGVALDSRQNVFVADAANFCIRKITPDGTVTTFAGTNEFGYANGTGTQARFRSPTRLAIDGQDNLYVVDGGNHRIRKITPAGLVTDAFGTPVSRPGGLVEMPALNQFSGVAVDRENNLYTTTAERVYRITPAGRVTIAAGYGLGGDTDGTAQTAYFSGLAGIAIDARGRLFVTESNNLRVRKISVKGVAQ